MSRESESTRIGFYIQNQLLERCDIAWKTHKFASRNDFVNKAIENYIATLTIENGGDAVIEKLAYSIDKYSESMGRKLSKSLYRYAVDIEMMMQMHAYILGLSDEEILKLRLHSMKEVKKLKGRLNLESVANFQKEQENFFGEDRRII